jgi:parallel beta-helix repeat protein
MNASINSPLGWCFYITASNITLDCNGSYLNGLQSLVYTTTLINLATIENCSINSTANQGIQFQGGITNLLLSNINFSGGSYGMRYLSNASNINITMNDISITNVTTQGIQLNGNIMNFTLNNFMINVSAGSQATIFGLNYGFNMTFSNGIIYGYNGIDLGGGNNYIINNINITSANRCLYADKPINDSVFTNINCQSNSTALRLTDGKNNMVENFTAYGNSIINMRGIDISGNSYNFTARNVNISNYYDGIQLGSVNLNILDNVVVSNNSRYGIYLQNANNTIINNSISEKSGQRGIYIATPCFNETIENATIYDMNYSSSFGLFVDRCKNVVLSDIEVYNINSTSSFGYGIRISGSNNTYAEKLVIHNVTRIGIPIVEGLNVAGSNNITIVNSESYDNYVGMDLSIIYNTTLENISSHDNIVLDYRILAATGSACHSLRSFINLTATDGKVPLFTNDTVDINPVPDNISGIYLCNSTGSKIKNGIFDGEDGIFAYRSNNLEISNIFIRERGAFSLLASVNDSILDNVSVYNTTIPSFGNAMGGNNITLKNSVFRMDKISNEYNITMFISGSGQIDIINSTFYNINDAAYPFVSGTFDTLVSPTDKLNITIINSYIYGNNVAFSIDNSRYGHIDIYNSRIERGSTNSSLGAIYTYCINPPCWNNNTYSLYNTTLTDYYINYSRLNVYWNLSVRNPLSASIKIYNLTGDEVASFSDSEDVWLLDYYVTKLNSRTNSTPHNITATKSGYVANTTSLTMDTSREFNIILASVPIIDQMPSITGQLVLTIGFGIMGLFSVMTLLYFGYSWRDPEMIAKVMIGITIIMLMIVAVWQGLVL